MVRVEDDVKKGNTRNFCLFYIYDSTVLGTRQAGDSLMTEETGWTSWIHYKQNKSSSLGTV